MAVEKPRRRRAISGLVVAIFLLGSRPAPRAADCNANCITDGVEIGKGASDCNGNGILDECELGRPAGDFVVSPALHPGGSIAFLVVADLDGDGLLDAAGANTNLWHESAGGTGITLYLQTERRELEAAASFLVPGALAQMLLVQDLDLDGDLDLVIASLTSRSDCSDWAPGLVHVIENRGERTFGTPVAFDARPAPMALAAGDLDGDGRPDLAKVDAARPGVARGSLSFLRNRGDLRFAAPVELLQTPKPDPAGLAIADIDQDGDQDLGAVHRSGVVYLFRNEGGGAFLPALEIAVGQPLDWIQAAHLDLDDRIDLLVGGKFASTSFPGHLHFLRNAGRGAFEKMDLEGGAAPASRVDLDGDGLPELISLLESRLHVHRSAGNGVFEPAEVRELPGRARDLAAAGVSASGEVEVITAGKHNVALIGGEAGISRLPLTVSPIGHLVGAADFDADGDIDLASVEVYGSSTPLHVFRNSGSGGFPLRDERFSPISGPLHSHTAGDVDGDGDVDIAAGSSKESSLKVLRNHGDATFGPMPDSFGLEVPGDIQAQGLALADFDGDGDLDAALSIALGVLRFENRGDGTFETGERLFLGSTPRSVASGDLENDGDFDLVTGNSPVRERSNVSVFTNEGGGAFPAARNHGVPAFPAWLGLGDLDRNGYLDIVSTGVSVLRQGEGGAFEEYFHHRPCSSGAIADMDGDGAPDVLVGRTLLRNRGDGTLLPADPVPCDSSRAVLAADLDADGDPDVAEGSYGFSITLDPEGILLPYPAPQYIPINTYLIDSADMDRDGDTDVLLAGVSSVASLENIDGTGLYASAEWRHLDPRSKVEALASGDLDEDGGVDVAAVHACVSLECPRELSFFLQGLAPASIDLDEVTENYPPFGTNVRSLSTSDLDGDGDLDLFGAYGAYETRRFSVFIALNRGNRDFSLERLSGVSFPISHAAAGDMDLDGDRDIVTERAIYRNRGNASFDAAAETNAPTDDIFSGLGLGDLDGDGDLDVIRGRWVFLNTGDGSLLHPVPLKSDLDELALADMDRDGDLDLVGYVLTDSTSSIVLHGNDGTGRLEASSAIPWGFNRLLRLQLADVNGDERLDILGGSQSGLVVLRSSIAEPLGPGSDLDFSGRLDACEKTYIRGDITADLVLDIADPIAILRHLFLGAAPPSCRETADVNKDDRMDLADAVHLLRYIFLGGLPPSEPRECGLDRSDLVVDCESYPAC